MIVNGKKIVCGACGCGCACCEKFDPCICGSCRNNPKHPDYEKFIKFIDDIKKEV